MKEAFKTFLIIFLLFVGYFPALTQVNQLLFEKRIHSDIANKKRTFRNNNTSSSRPTNQLKRCNTIEADIELRRKYPALPASEVMEKELQKKITIYKKQQSLSRTTATVYVIPVIVHVVHNGQAVGVGPNITAAQVMSQIDVLNEDFRRKTGTPGANTHAAGADVEIEFALAQVDPEGVVLSEPGVNRVHGGKSSWDSFDDLEKVLKPKTQWDPTKYLNIWTVEYGGGMSDNLGYAQFPVLSGLSGMDDRTAGLAETDGVVMRYSAFGREGNLEAPFDQGRTTTHEIGHWLGLRHIWGDEQGCTGTDYCSDTPASRGPNYGCPKGTNSCTAAGNDMIENYMDYTNDGCMNIFTTEQKARMRTVMEKSSRRKELLSSTVHLPSTNTKPFAVFEADKTGACAGSTIEFTDKSTNKPTSWKWYFLDGDSTVIGSSTLRNPSFVFNLPGSYSVTLIVTNAKGNDTVHYPNYLTIVSDSNLDFPFSNDFEGNTTIAEWISYNPDKDREWHLSSEASANGVGVGSLYFDNFSEESNPSEKVDAVISSKIDLSTNRFAEISFDVAYAMYDNDYQDTLALYYSTDCGETFIPFWSKGGPDLATAPNTTDEFIPTSSQWRKEKISLAFLNGESNVYLAIANISGWGNFLYVDNVKIDVPTPTEAPVTFFNTFKTTTCAGSSIQFNDSSQNNPRTWSWTFEGGEPSVSALQNPSITYSSPGVYSVSLSTSNAIGSDFETKTGYITVQERQLLTITASDTIVCEDETVELTAHGGQNYEWYGNRGLIGTGASIFVEPIFTNTYTVKEPTGSCYSEGTIQIQVNPAPEQPEIQVSDPYAASFTLTSSSATGNQWMFNDVPIPGATQQEYSGDAAGSYSVMVTMDGCSNTSLSVALTADDHSIGISNLIMLYPNPAQDKLEIVFNGKKGKLDVKAELYSSIGQKLYQEKLPLENGRLKTSFGLKKYSPGTYFIVISEGDKRYTRSFVKE